ncbi:MAG: flagellar basal body protein FliL [Caulobacterales bacterium 32-69-10]|nr:MAG: flagellar basal body protein FliL [Caulobacterales bacterium 32-69-10]
MAKKDKGHAAPEGEAAEGEGHEAKGKKKPPMMIIIAAVGALVVLGGGGAGAFLLLGKKPAAEAGAHGEEAAHGKEDKKKKDEKKEGGHGGAEGKEGGPSPITEGPDGVVFYTMPDLIVNIQAADSRPTFLKLKLAFELPDEAVAEEIEPNQPRLADMFQTFLRELRPEDLSGSQGSYQLRMEILRRVNLVIAPSKVNAVLIQEMLVQ